MIGIGPLLPHTIYSACWRKRPFCGREFPLSHTAVPLQIQPAHCRASVIDGYCLQSMNRQIGAPFLQAFRTSYSHSAIQCVQDLWSLLSPSKSGSAFAALMLLYFWLVVRFLSFCFVPPDAYGGSVITASKIPGWNALTSFSVSPCKIFQFFPSAYSSGYVPSFISSSKLRSFVIGIILSVLSAPADFSSLFVFSGRTLAVSVSQEQKKLSTFHFHIRTYLLCGY